MARDTRTRLLDTAERLFAERGIEATSVRDIVGAARANLGAITYHFGSKDALVRSVVERRLVPLNRERERLLDAAEHAAAGRPPSLEAILRAVLAPTVELRREHPRFLRFLGRLHAEPRVTLQRCAEAVPLFRRILATVARAAPHLAPDEIAWRLLFLKGAMIETWTGAHRFGEVTGTALALEDDAAIVERLVRFGAAGLRAKGSPARASRRPRPRAVRAREGVR